MAVQGVQVIPIPEPLTVNTLKAAEIAQVTERTIYNWMRSGRIEFRRTAGHGVRIYVDSLFREPAE